MAPSPMPSPAPTPSSAAHALPRWVAFIQDHVFLSFLLLAEAYLLGTLMTLGWVRDIEAPSTWGAYHAVGVVLFFAAGAMAAGVALRCSVTAAAAFREHRLFIGSFNLLGLLTFSVAEIWASLSERSANLRPTPADSAVLALLGIGTLPVSPTIVAVALLLPFATLYWGFAQQGSGVKVERETEEEQQTRMAGEERQALHGARMAAIRMANGRQTFQVLLGKVDPLHVPGLGGEGPGASGDNLPGEDGSDAQGLGGEGSPLGAGGSPLNPPPPAQAALRLVPESRRPRNVMDKAQLVGWAHEVLGATITEEQALRLIQSTTGNRRLEGVSGKPWVAPRISVQAQARKLWTEVSA